MLRGRLGNTTGAPYLEAHIFFPRLGLRGLISFLVDTGADSTVLMPPDSMKLGVDFSSLTTQTICDGIGGPANCFSERAMLSFADKRYVYSYIIAVDLLVPNRHNLRMPSLLGRDLMNRWRSVFYPSKELVSFTPLTWDVRHKL